MHMKKLILATGNPGKVREMKQILKGMYDEILSMNAMSFQMIPGFA